MTELPAGAEVAALLANSHSSILLRARQLQRAHLCWSSASEIDAREMKALAVQLDNSGSHEVWVDRYGGHGIGGNGGAGRAGFVDGYYLKGIGPTPLIGRTADIHHASGGTYLEEAVREAVFAEIFAAELPWGAVRTHAIIDTREDQVWDPDPASTSPVPRERRVLVVRKACLRPAHFMRANHFTGDPQRSGLLDVRRVRHNLRRAPVGGRDAFGERLHDLWLRWADQCAYQFASRLSQGPASPSNIDIEGRLMDFGAATALPNWDAAVITPGEPEFGHELATVNTFLIDFYDEHRDIEPTGGQSWQKAIARLRDRCEARYHATLGLEMLRLAGLRRATIALANRSKSASHRLAEAAEIAARNYRRRFRPSIESGRDSTEWDFLRFWSDRPPAHLAPLRSIADHCRGMARGEPVEQRMRVRCAPREYLYRESMRARLQKVLLPMTREAAVDSRMVAALIRQNVVGGRRDSRHEPPNAHLAGFAAVGNDVFSLFRTTSGAVLAFEELKSDPATKAAVLPFARGAIGGREVDAVHFV